jgi:serine protease Do
VGRTSAPQALGWHVRCRDQGIMRTVRWLLVALFVVAALVVSGVVSVKVDIGRPKPDGASASPFWKETAAANKDLPGALGIWVELARGLKPAVVNVSTSQRVSRGPLGDDFFKRFFGEPGGPSPRARTSLGSGFLVAPDGYVVTNFHVVREAGDAGEIVVKLNDQSEHRARLVGSDPKTDIALLKIEARDLPTIPFGDSDRLEVGEPVMAIGNPFGLDQTVTTGIVSAKERFIGAGPYDDFIQIDASINPGNSGGPLIDARGALVGINTAIFSQGGGWSGIGFAIPVNIAKDVLSQLKQHGRVTRGYLGVAVAPVPPDAARAAGIQPRQGAMVAEVVPGSPAADAGLKPGDVITAFQNTRVEDPHALTRRVGGTRPGTRVTLELARDGQKQTVTTTLAQLRDDAPPRAPRGR